jgi:saccharopine dehydrogenase-like NADP-dependent oxidoreductase
VSGRKDGRLIQETYANKVYSAVVAGRMQSAIQITTAGSICAVLDMLADGSLRAEGFVRQEEIALPAFLANRFGRYYAQESHGARAA